MVQVCGDYVEVLTLCSGMVVMVMLRFLSDLSITVASVRVPVR